MIDYRLIMMIQFPDDPVHVREPFDNYNNITFLGNTHHKNDLDALWLDTQKHMRKLAIDKRTAQLFAQGFTYDGVLFSLSPVSQLNWNAIEAERDELTYPFDISTKDGGEYQLPDAAAVHAFALTGLGAGQAYYDAGRNLRLLIDAATTQAELDAIVDDR